MILHCGFAYCCIAGPSLVGFCSSVSWFWDGVWPAHRHARDGVPHLRVSATSPCNAAAYVRCLLSMSNAMSPRCLFLPMLLPVLDCAQSYDSAAMALRDGHSELLLLPLHPAEWYRPSSSTRLFMWKCQVAGTCPARRVPVRSQWRAWRWRSRWSGRRCIAQPRESLVGGAAVSDWHRVSDEAVDARANETRIEK